MPQRILNGVEHSTWQSMLTVITVLPSELELLLQQKYGLTHFQYRVLALLARQPDRRQRMYRLAEDNDSSISRLSLAVTNLERAGLLTRTRVDAERGVNAVLTTTGAEVLTRAELDYTAAIRRLFLDACPAPHHDTRHLTALAHHLKAHRTAQLTNGPAPEATNLCTAADCASAG